MQTEPWTHSTQDLSVRGECLHYLSTGEHQLNVDIVGDITPVKSKGGEGRGEGILM